MRIIRTELYFEDRKIKGATRHRRFRPEPREESQSPGIAFAWFRTDATGPFSIENFKWFEGQQITSGQVPVALDLLLRDEDGLRLRHRFDDEGDLKNKDVVDFVLEQSVILEHSPPSAIKFKDLLKKTNAPIYVGAYMGFHMAGDSPALMLLTVPGGILAVGAALGISDAIAYGLNKNIKRLFDGR